MSKSGKARWASIISELLVVILGITIAFWIEETATNAKQRAEEERHLRGIADDLENDARFFNEYSGYNEQTLHFLQRLNRLIAKQQKSDSLNWLLLRAGWISNHKPRNISYQSLKSSGSLDKITNFALRKEIVYHYEQKMEDVYFLNELHNKHLNDYITPVQITYSDFTSTTMADPIIYKSREITNAFAGLEGQIRNKIDAYHEARIEVDSLLIKINNELKNF